MNILAICTVASACEAALLRTDGEVFFSQELMQRGHDVRLPAIVEAVLGQAGVEYSELDRISVVVGPGSFTGVRVGVAYARGLGLALNIPVIGVTSLEAARPNDASATKKGRWLGVLPACKRPPDLSWWSQSFLDGVAQAAPEEITVEQLAEGLSAADGVFGGPVGTDIDLQGVQLIDSAVDARLAVRFAARIVDPAVHPARPAYVRPPDAAPAKPPKSKISSGPEG